MDKAKMVKVVYKGPTLENTGTDSVLLRDPPAHTGHFYLTLITVLRRCNLKIISVFIM